jgi:hypothetical protein
LLASKARKEDHRSIGQQGSDLLRETQIEPPGLMPPVDRDPQIIQFKLRAQIPAFTTTTKSPATAAIQAQFENQQSAF